MKIKNVGLKSFPIILAICAICLCFPKVLRSETVMLSVGYGYLFPNDSGFKGVYGKSVRLPEFKLGVRFISDFYLYGSFFTFSKDGLTPELQESAHSKQQFLGGGIGYFPNLTKNKKWKGFAGVGVMNVNYKEETMELLVKGNKIGFLIECGLYFREKYMFLGLNAAYVEAKDTYEEVNFKMGGARTSVVLGFIF
ncbi:MAG TPA: hypothetical protein PLB50_05970 [Candidatus Saccharicenans sp.]|jgi:hypothetical protein|nr:hypothetical protein [Candidatus Saccharicenans sp.]HQO76211.1 hypothetical protein [Candidatus Saccharicenans sp.]HUM78842.1 hypothetical protein [Candidatus Saccharicenans sp.]